MKMFKGFLIDLSAVTPCKDADDLCTGALDLADRSNTRCGLGAKLGGRAEISASEVGGLCLFGLKYVAQSACDRVERSVLHAEINVERDMVQVGMAMQ